MILNIFQLLSIFSIVFSATWTQSATATPCSCWDSGTSAHMGAKCHAAWENASDSFHEMIETCKNFSPYAPLVCVALVTGLPEIGAGISAMETCHHLCNAAQERGASGYKGREWWYADQTAYDACLKQNTKDHKVLLNWTPPPPKEKKKQPHPLK